MGPSHVFEEHQLLLATCQILAHTHSANNRYQMPYVGQGIDKQFKLDHEMTKSGLIREMDNGCLILVFWNPNCNIINN